MDFAIDNIGKFINCVGDNGVIYCLILLYDTGFMDYREIKNIKDLGNGKYQIELYNYKNKTITITADDSHRIVQRGNTAYNKLICRSNGTRIGELGLIKKEAEVN